VSCFAERALAAVDPARLLRLSPAPAASGRSLASLCRAALEKPVDSPPLAALAHGARSIAVIVSDATRDEPREAMLDAVFEHVPRARATLVVASGTHAADASVIPARYADLPVVVHDADAGDRLVDLGATARSTPVRLLAEVARAELVICASRVRPHYFAGFSGGTKGVFPGVADKQGALDNHRLKSEPSARLGRVEDNVCRLDMEEAALRLPKPPFVLNVLCDIDGNAVDAAAGHPIAAHRALLGSARELFTVEGPRSAVVVVADRPPVTRSLYQASKLLPPAGALLEDGGTVVVVAECDAGTGPLERVNEGIYRLGVARQLPARHRVLLVSKLAPDEARKSYAEPVSSLASALDEALARHGQGRAVLLWRAGECIARPCETEASGAMLRA
jgi:nickel-dependent lactate racemase